MLYVRLRFSCALLLGAALVFSPLTILGKKYEEPEVKKEAKGVVYRVKSEKELNDLIAQTGITSMALKFETEWCSYCKKASPKFKELAGMYPDVLFISVAADEEPGQAVANKYKVSGFPTFIFIRDGVEKDRAVGFNNDLLHNKTCAFASEAKGVGKKAAPAAPIKAEIEQEIDQEELAQLVKMVEEEMKKLEAEEKELGQESKQIKEIAKEEAKKKGVEKKKAPAAKGVQDLNSYQELESIVVKSDKPVVARFHANWCPHCQKNGPVYQKIAVELGNDAVFVQMEESVMKKYDKELEKFDIEAFPTFVVLYKNVNNQRKVQNSDKLKQDIKQAVYEMSSEKKAAGKNGKPASKPVAENPIR